MLGDSDSDDEDLLGFDIGGSQGNSEPPPPLAPAGPPAAELPAFKLPKPEDFWAREKRLRSLGQGEGGSGGEDTSSGERSDCEDDAVAQEKRRQRREERRRHKEEEEERNKKDSYELDWEDLGNTQVTEAGETFYHHLRRTSLKPDDLVWVKNYPARILRKPLMHNLKGKLPGPDEYAVEYFPSGSTARYLVGIVRKRSVVPYCGRHENGPDNARKWCPTLAQDNLKKIKKCKSTRMTHKQWEAIIAWSQQYLDKALKEAQAEEEEEMELNEQVQAGEECLHRISGPSAEEEPSLPAQPVKQTPFCAGEEKRLKAGDFIVYYPSMGCQPKETRVSAVCPGRDILLDLDNGDILRASHMIKLTRIWRQRDQDFEDVSTELSNFHRLEQFKLIKSSLGKPKELDVEMQKGLRKLVADQDRAFQEIFNPDAESEGGVGTGGGETPTKGTTGLASVRSSSRTKAQKAASVAQCRDDEDSDDQAERYAKRKLAER